MTIFINHVPHHDKLSAIMISISVSGLTDAFRGVLGIERGLHSAFGNTFGCGNLCRGYGSFLENLDNAARRG